MHIDATTTMAMKKTAVVPTTARNTPMAMPSMALPFSVSETVMYIEITNIPCTIYTAKIKFVYYMSSSQFTISYYL